MKEDSKFLKNVCGLALPVALQSMLQSSFCLVDQIMIGQLGSTVLQGLDLPGNSLPSIPLWFRQSVQLQAL